jgi:phage gp29-like protein
VVATQDATFDNPYGFADLSLCFWPVTFKKAGWSFWMRFSEKYGTPWVVGRHPRGQDQAHIGPLLHSLEQMVNGSLDKTLQPLLAPLFDAVQSGVAPRELRGKLAALYPEIPADALQETLARVMFVANVWGRLHADTQ